MSINKKLHLNPKLFTASIEQEPSRNGFGRGLVFAANKDKNVVALCADLTESTRMEAFAEEFPDRFIEVGVAEQNLVTVASGMAHLGKIPFTSSYAVFSPGRNWEQIRTAICLNDRNVKIIGSHAGVSVGADGATHQMLEDITLMRVLPNMTVIVPCDSLEAQRAVIEMAAYNGPGYLRLAREKSPIITTLKTPFKIGQAEVFRSGQDVTVIACGNMVYQALRAAEQLKKSIDTEVINCATIKPLDNQTILQSAEKTGLVITVEEHQIYGGLGGAVAELLAEELVAPVVRMGINDRFGESGEPDELLEHFGLTAEHIAGNITSAVKKYKQHGSSKKHS